MSISWGVKAADAYFRQPYRILVSTVLKSGNLSMLEPSGPVQILLNLYHILIIFLENVVSDRGQSELLHQL